MRYYSRQLRILKLDCDRHQVSDSKGTDATFLTG